MGKYYMLGLLVFGLNGCVVNETLTHVNKSLNDTTSVLSSTLSTAPEQDIAHLIPNVNDNIQKQQIIDAKPTIQKVLSLVACTTDSKGTFMLNTENHTITFTDCDLLHTPGWTDRSTNWRKDLKILELDENHLRVAVMRDNSEGAWWLIWNFVSKEFADNYVPEDQPDPEPTLPDGWKDAVS